MFTMSTYWAFHEVGSQFSYLSEKNVGLQRFS